MLGAIGILVVGLALYGLWSVRSTRADLVQAGAGAHRLQRALSDQDSDASAKALNDLHDDFSRAHDRTDGLLWAVAARLPVVGDDADAVRTVSAVGDELSGGTIAELIAQMGGGLADRLVPRGGGVNLQAVESLAPLVSRAQRNVKDALNRVQDADTAGLTRWVRPSYDTFADRLEQVDSAIGAADRAVRVLPTMLGKDGPRNYLVMFQNNAEMRATGGLPGAYAIVTTDRGRVTLGRQGAGAEIAQFAAPVLPQDEAEKLIYSDDIAEYFVDTNFTPEFPRTAALVREMWQREAGQKVDGVLSVDAVTLGYVLRATGPIQVPGGVRLTSSNANAELLNGAYLRLPDNAAQDLFFKNVASLVFEHVLDGVDAPALVSALGQSASEGRLYVHDFDASVQGVLAGTTVAGELTRGDPRAPQVGVYFNDATGSKMSYYLRTDVQMKAESCAQGRQQLAGTADLEYTKDSPPVAQLNKFVTGPGNFGTPKGEQLVLVRVYGPEGGELSNFRVAGTPTDVDTVDDRGRPVGTTVVQLRRGETIRVSWRVRSGADQAKATRVSVSPGLEARPAVTHVKSACGS